MDATDPSAKRVGTTLKDKWVLEELLGVGGMASVYVGRHKIGRREAIKILHADIAKSEQLRARFEQEAAAVNAFRHPGVVEIRDVDITEDGAPFLVMELLEGESLSARVRRDPPLTEEEVLKIVSETLDVLAAAHDRGIIHRDIKPDNLFLTKDGRVKVLDFGIARVRSSAARAKTTKVGVTLGTMAYMPPEQAKGQEIDARADVYAVGATAFRLLARRQVHHTTSDGELVMKVMTDPAPSLASVVAGVRVDLALVVDRALAFDRELRYPDAKTMQRDVEEVRSGGRPSYASSLPPLPAAPPPSVRVAPASAPKPEPPTFVPPAKREEAAPTRVEPATRAANVDIPAAAMPTRVTEPRSAPHPPQGVVLTPFGELAAYVKPQDKRNTTYIAALLAVGVLVLLVFAALVIFALVRAHDGEGPSHDPVILKPEK